MRRRAAVIVFLTAPVAWPGVTAAQVLPDRSFPPPAPAADGVLRTPGGAFTASLVVPGAGQAALGLRRWPLYLAAEAGLWWANLDARGDFDALSRRYRDLAWEVARLGEGTDRVDGGWGYYENMSRFVESGSFDTDPAPGVQPETDASTYNGSIWQLARGLFLPEGTGEPGDPGYQDALAYYERRAAGPEFLWTWSGAEAEQERFRSLIRDADDENRQVTRTLGLILANHLVSAIDALIVARLRSGDGARLRGRVEPGPGGPRLHVGLHIPPFGTE